MFAVAVQALAPQEHTRAPAAATVVHAAYLTLAVVAVLVGTLALEDKAVMGVVGQHNEMEQAARVVLAAAAVPAPAIKSVALGVKLHPPEAEAVV